MMLLKSRKIMHAPITQDPPPMTEDMHEERLKGAEALGDSFICLHLRLQILMLSLKILFDGIHHGTGKTMAMRRSECLNPVYGLLVGNFQRECPFPGNSWRKIWNEAPAVPASEQKPLWDPNREGEKVLHYLETLRPCQLLEQMICTAFRAAADTINQTSFSDMKQMTIKMEQLYMTIASMLKYLHAQSTTSDIKLLEDLRRLCTTFEHIENLILLAASLHGKILQSQYLAQAIIFSDCYNFYLPNTGTSSANAQVDTKREFNEKQEIKARDRDLILSMFTPPTANQSWRKVLSMGNLLNGHEPILREIIFSKHDRVSGSYYAALSPKLYQHDIETYRMYVSGTSNDLGVALAVASFD